MARTLRAAPSELRITIRFLSGASRRPSKRLKLTVGLARKRAVLRQLIRRSVRRMRRGGTGTPPCKEVDNPMARLSGVFLVALLLGTASLSMAFEDSYDCHALAETSIGWDSKLRK